MFVTLPWMLSPKDIGMLLHAEVLAKELMAEND